MFDYSTRDVLKVLNFIMYLCAETLLRGILNIAPFERIFSNLVNLLKLSHSIVSLKSYSILLWKVKSDIIQCIHLCFCMLAISFYFVNCFIISCELYYDNSFGCILTNYK